MRNSVLALAGAFALAACSHAAGGKWEGKLVQGPGTTPEAQKVYVVQSGKRHWVAHAEWLISHGYQWPGDVNRISLQDLEALPVAEPILDVK